jgi:hypothetical protein
MRQFPRSLIRILATAVLLLTTAPAVQARQLFPDEIALPIGWRPEGIVRGRGPVIYAGSLANGAIYAANARTGEGTVLVQGQEGRVAVGLDFDRRTGYIYVAGGPTGAAHVYDATTGAEVAAYQLATGTPENPTFINDVILSRKAAYFTDSQRPVLYRLPLGPGGSPPAPDAVQTIQLSGDYQQVPGFNANGIEARANDNFVIVVNSTLGTLYRVDPATGVASLIDLGGATVTMGDGILLRGHTLYVVRNQANQIVEIELADDFRSGRVVDRIRNPAFDVPTTITWFRGALYAVNARFGVPNPETQPFSIVRVPVT